MSPSTPTAARLLTVNEACAALGGISRPTFYKLLKSGGLPVVKLRNRTFVRPEDLDALISRNLSRGAA